MLSVTCIDVGGTFIKAANVICGEIRDETKIRTGQPALLKRTLFDIILKMGGEAVGIGFAGLIDKDGMVSKSPNLPGLGTISLKELIAEELHIPVFIDNDANLAALGEWKYGAGRGVNALVMFTLGTGIGGGILIDGKLYHGSGYAGEVGHITVERDGPLCQCGNYGCLESYIGAEKITERAEEYVTMGITTTLKDYDKITPEIIGREAGSGDSMALEIVSETARFLGLAISTYCAILDPQRIILGGGLSGLGEPLLSGVRKEVQKRLYSRKDIDIVFSQLGNRAGLLGCYEMVMGEMADKLDTH